MRRSSPRVRTALILPLVLLTVSLLEEIGWAYLRSEIRSVFLRVLVRIVLVGSAFSIAAEYVEPALRGVFTGAHAMSRRGIGARVGPWSFFAIAYGMLFVAYYVLETRGTRAFLF